MAQRPSKAAWLVAGALAGAATTFLTVRARKKRRVDFNGASVVITGGSRGLGLELARQFSRQGALVALLARDSAELEQARRQLAAADATVLTYLCDLRRQEEVEATVASLVKDLGRIDVLVNNAGIVQVSPVEHLSRRDFEDAMAIHAWAPLFMIQAVLPVMKRQGGGRIVNISSIGGLVAVPHLVPYSMSKFALTGLSDGLRGELVKDGIRVTTVAPGLMRTGSHRNAFFKGNHKKEFAWFSIAAATPFFSTSAHHAAEKIIEACRYGDPRLIITLPAKLLHLLNANLPGLTASAMALANRLLPGPRGLEGNRLQTGWESRSALAPSLLTRMADRASERNNECHTPPPHRGTRVDTETGFMR